MLQMQTNGSHIPRFEEDLIKKRKNELKHAQDIREHYERKLERANNLYMELSAVLLQLEQREKDLIRLVIFILYITFINQVLTNVIYLLIN